MSLQTLILEQYEADLKAASERLVALTTLITSLQQQAIALQFSLDNDVVKLKTISEENPNGGQTLEGNYYFGDLSPAQGGQATREAKVVFGPTSFLEIRSLPKVSTHAVPKGYVDNIVSPLYTQLAQAITGRTTAFLTLYKNGTDNSINMSNSNILSASDNYENTFAIQENQHSMRIRIAGIYYLAWKLAPATVTSNVIAALKLDNNEINRMMLSPGNSDTIALAIRINKDSVIDWSIISGLCSSIHQSLSLIKLGE